MIFVEILIFLKRTETRILIYILFWIFRSLVKTVCWGGTRNVNGHLTNLLHGLPKLVFGLELSKFSFLRWESLGRFKHPLEAPGILDFTSHIILNGPLQYRFGGNCSPCFLKLGAHCFSFAK